MLREELNYILQKANFSELKSLYEKIDKKYGVNVINQPTPQTLLVPVNDPISKSQFYGGEALVTSCIVNIKNQKGWSMVQDENKELALYVATIDAVFESQEFQSDIQQLFNDTVETITLEKNKLNKKVNATRVSFDLM